MRRSRFVVVVLLGAVPGLAACGEAGGAASPPGQRSTASPPATPTTSATPRKPAGTRIGRYRNVTLSRGQGGLGLVPAPGEKRFPEELYQGDPLWRGEDLDFDNEITAHRIKVLPIGVRGGYRVCRDRTGRSTAVQFEAVYVGSQICVITESGLVGLVKVKTLRWGPSPGMGIFVFDLNVWQGAG
jgi:hypothetical protein